MRCCIDGIVAAAFFGVPTIGRKAYHRGWPGAARLASLWRDHRPHLWAVVRSSPATFAYLGVLTVTAWALLGASSASARAVLADHSTNLHHLAVDPVRVLVRSAFWLDSDYELLLWVVPFVLVLAPAERWLGTARWLVAFAAGHVGATLATGLGIWLAIRSGLAESSLANAVDVGVSYGFLAVAALFSYRLRARQRAAWVAALALIAVIGILANPDFAAVGHAVALAIGFALYPLTRAAPVRHRARRPALSNWPGRERVGSASALRQPST